MPNQRLAALPSASALGGSELFYSVQSATDVQVTGTQIKTFTSASPTLVTPTLGVAAGTSIALGGATIGTNALAVTGTVLLNSAVTMGAALTYGGVTLSNSVTGTGSMVLATSPTITTPTISGTLSTANVTITSTSANALAVGPSGTTNPSFNVDASTASAVNGINIKAGASGTGAALSVISSAGADNLKIDAKSTGTITIAGTSTGAITLGQATTLSGALTYGGVTLSNSVTGTGSMVLATSPTLTTPVIGAATGTSLLLSGGAFAVAESALVDGATPALDASKGLLFTLSAAGDRTIAVPSNPSSGQHIVIRHLASGGARTLSLNTSANGFRFGSDITGLTQTASGKTDYIGCIWNVGASFWDVVAYTKGF